VGEMAPHGQSHPCGPLLSNLRLRKITHEYEAPWSTGLGPVWARSLPCRTPCAGDAGTSHDPRCNPPRRNGGTVWVQQGFEHHAAVGDAQFDTAGAGHDREIRRHRWRQARLPDPSGQRSRCGLRQLPCRCCSASSPRLARPWRQAREARPRVVRPTGYRITVNSMRRFTARPFSLLLLAFGLVSP
jgi:hypothetical protein